MDYIDEGQKHLEALRTVSGDIAIAFVSYGNSLDTVTQEMKAEIAAGFPRTEQNVKLKLDRIADAMSELLSVLGTEVPKFMNAQSGATKAFVKVVEDLIPQYPAVIDTLAEAQDAARTVRQSAENVLEQCSGIRRRLPEFGRLSPRLQVLQQKLDEKLELLDQTATGLSDQLSSIESSISKSLGDGLK